MRLFRSFPLPAILWVVYNLMMLTGQVPALLNDAVLRLTLPSGAGWQVSAGDLFVFAGVLFLYVEVFKATRTGASSILNHTFSVLTFILFLLEFVVVQGAGNSVFFTLTLMALVDVVAGFSVTIMAARRDVGLGNPSDF